MTKTIILIMLIVLLVGASCVIYTNHHQIRYEQERFNKYIKSNQWWEMIVNNCGIGDANKNIDYCRGFDNGYDYCAGYFEVDCATREIYPNKDNPNYYNK